MTQYQKTLRLLEMNPSHPSLRLHKLEGKLSDLFSVTINISYRIVLEFVIKEKEIILINIGTHNEVYWYIQPLQITLHIPCHSCFLLHEKDNTDYVLTLDLVLHYLETRKLDAKPDTELTKWPYFLRHAGEEDERMAAIRREDVWRRDGDQFHSTDYRAVGRGNTKPLAGPIVFFSLFSLVYLFVKSALRLPLWAEIENFPRSGKLSGTICVKLLHIKSL